MNSLLEQTQEARHASHILANLATSEKNAILQSLAHAIRSEEKKILDANQKDCERAQKKVDEGEMSSALYKRLVLDSKKVKQMAENLESVAQLEDPVGVRQMGTRLDQGLDLYRVSCPIGVILAIFEARPEVVVQISALALKSGNAVLLKGGSEAQYSNQAIFEVLQDALKAHHSVPQESIILLQTREDVNTVIQMDQHIDLVIPRGSNQLVQSIQKHSTIPILAHADGICHVYVDKDADTKKAIDIVVDSKTEYPAVCNALETLLIHPEFPKKALHQMLKKLQKAGVELRVCAYTEELLKDMSDIEYVSAKVEDWQTEYTDLILSIKTVSSLKEAVDHINAYGSHHTDAIVTESADRAEWFMNQVDTANAFWNASTRFADGFRYGFGAEVGISTSRTHARGPVGLEGLVIYKYKLYGQGQTVAPYSQGKQQFQHERIL